MQLLQAAGLSQSSLYAKGQNPPSSNERNNESPNAIQQTATSVARVELNQAGILLI
jgi:hypothetical protein